MALCTMRGTLRHIGSREVAPAQSQEVAPTQLQEVAPNAKSHKAKISFVKIYFLNYRKLNAFSCLCQ